VLAFLDGDILRAHGLDGAAGLDEAGEAGQLAGFAVVEDDHINALEKGEELGLRDVDPEVHGVGNDEAGLLHLVEDVVLKTGSDVREKDAGRGGVAGGEGGVKCSKTFSSTLRVSRVLRSQ